MKLTTAIRAGDWWLIRELRPTNAFVATSVQRFSELANDGKVWVGSAAILAATGRQGRRSAGQGLLAMGTTSILVNGVLKRVARRSRPSGLMAVGLSPTGRAPKTSSFPSGHAASATAFATAASLGWPALTIPLGAAALAVSWSRVVSIRHFPSDVAGGVAVGALCGVATDLIARRISRDARRDPSAAAGGVTDPAVSATVRVCDEHGSPPAETTSPGPANKEAWAAMRRGPNG
ncbi:MAG: hypothetical protein NVSMB32_10850 [Actinomycetota bacterium]